MSDNVVGIIGGTVGIGRYIVNDYVITLTEAEGVGEGEYGYTMTITKGTETQTVTLYGLTAAQYDQMVSNLQQAQAAAQEAQSAATAASRSATHAASEASSAYGFANDAKSARAQAQTSASNASTYKSQAQTAATAAETAQTAAETAATNAQAAKADAEAAAAAAAAAQTAAETAEAHAGDSASQASASAQNAADSASEAERVLDSIPADYSQMGADVADLKSAINETIDTGLASKALPVDAAPTGWKLLDSGLCTTDSSAKLVKYKVTAGNLYKIVSDYKAQFQTSASVPSYGSPNRVGITYGIGTFFAVAPETATYLIVSTSVSGSTANAYEMDNPVPANFYTPYSLTWTDGKAYNAYGDLITSNGYSSASFDISAFRGETVSGTLGLAPDGPSIGFKDNNGILIESYRNTTAGTYKFEFTKTVPNNAKTMFLSKRNENEDIYSAPKLTYNGVFRKFEEAYGYGNDINNINDLIGYQMKLPTLRNGSVRNVANDNMVTTEYVIPINHHYRFLRVDFILDESLADAYAFIGCLFKGSTDGMTTSEAMADDTVAKLQFNQNATDTQQLTYKYFDVAEWADYDHVSFAAWRSENGTAVPIRIANDPKAIRISYFSAPDEYNDNDALFKLKNARHIKGNTATPLTLLHFSDLHKDTSALARIMSEAKGMGTNIDDAICTGDMVLNSAEQIASWWDKSVMTCIGNHDSASYSDGTYDWTALSMADRDAYYITPFKSNWGITHTSGTSYYYKDYATQKVRLIVMDVMLYTNNVAEATAQTAWLEGLLGETLDSADDAYGYHVLIAIHAPHGGAVAEDCSFSRYEQTAMPPLPDCDTPQTVIDAVAAAIANGLHFIGYLVGHTHQDNIWDAEGDGKQLMYCVTCAIVSQEAQWKNSDQYRGKDADAYNLVTIDTANTLVKIVRGGGADMDDHMRTRKAICFNYSTGEKVGEVL